MRGVKEKIQVGFRIRMLTILREVTDRPSDSRRQVEVACECGRIKTMLWRNVKYGRTQSCGCVCLGDRETMEPDSIPNAKWIPTTRRQWTLVDDDVYWVICKHRWSLTGGSKPYAATRINNIHVRLHHLVIGCPPEGLQVDHINGNTLDNRRCNLRFATPSQNCQNKAPALLRKWKGIRQYKCGWMARIRTPDGRICLGTFKTDIEAARAYNEAAKRLFGEFARLNIIPDEVQ